MCALGRWGACIGQVIPQPEACNQKDDDCDGVVDEDCDQHGTWTLTTFAGLRSNYQDGPARQARFNRPSDVVQTSSGDIYITDTKNHRIRKIDTNNNVTTFAGSGVAGFQDGKGTSAQFNTPNGITIDAAGNLYVADTENNRIRKIDPSGNVTTIAGSTSGFVDGRGTNATFFRPRNLAVDTNNNIYVSDTQNHAIRKIDTSGNVTTIAGNGSIGFTNGKGATASFNTPQGIVVNASGGIYVADTRNHAIRYIDPQGVTSTYSGTGMSGFKNGGRQQAIWNNVTDLSIDSSGNLFAADSRNQCVRKIDASGVVTTFSGSRNKGYKDSGKDKAEFRVPVGIHVKKDGGVLVADTLNHLIRLVAKDGSVTTTAGYLQGVQNGQAEQVLFHEPTGLTFDKNDHLIVTDRRNDLIRKVTPDGTTTTLINVGTPNQADDPVGVVVDTLGNIYFTTLFTNQIHRLDLAGLLTTFAGSTQATNGKTDAQGTQARFFHPAGMGIHTDNQIYVADKNNHCIRKIDPQGNVTTIAGSTKGFQDGQGTSAKFNNPIGVTLDTLGHIYIADTENHNIRQIDPQGNVITFAGSTKGYKDAKGANAQFSFPYALHLSQQYLFVADTNNHVIRQIDINGHVKTIAGVNTAGFLDGPATKAMLDSPVGITSDKQGRLYISEAGNHRIRRLTQFTFPHVTTFVGNRTKGNKDGRGETASFHNTNDIISAPDGGYYVSDTKNHLIRKISAFGQVITFAGDGTSGFKDGKGVAAQFDNPKGLALDSTGQLYVADAHNHRIRKIDPQGNVTTFAGDGTKGTQDGQALSTQFDTPRGLAFDSVGNLYVTDSQNHRVRKIDTQGNVTTFAGSGQGFKDGQGTQAQFDRPWGIVLDDKGNVYIADMSNHRIRKIDPQGNVTTLAGSGAAGFKDDKGSQAQLNSPQDLAMDASGNLYVTDTENHAIRKIDAQGNVTTIAGIGSPGHRDGLLSSAMFDTPSGLLLQQKTLFVTQRGESQYIRRISLP